MEQEDAFVPTYCVTNTRMTKTQTLFTIPALALLVLVGGAIAGYTTLASADTETGMVQNMRAMMQARAPHIGGTIAAINGTTLTITGGQNHSGTYTVNAANAKVTKDGAAATLASYAVGERVMVEGTIDGTNITATNISNQKGFGKGGGRGMRGKGHGVMGTVSAVNGSTITLTGPDGASYTVDASSANVQKMVAGALTDVVVGDRIGVHGDVSGTSVKATRIMDDMPQMPAVQQ